MGHVVSTCECRYVVEMFKRKKTKENQTNQPVLTMSVCLLHKTRKRKSRPGKVGGVITAQYFTVSMQQIAGKERNSSNSK